MSGYSVYLSSCFDSVCLRQKFLSSLISHQSQSVNVTSTGNQVTILFNTFVDCC